MAILPDLSFLKGRREGKKEEREREGKKGRIVSKQSRLATNSVLFPLLDPFPFTVVVVAKIKHKFLPLVVERPCERRFLYSRIVTPSPVTMPKILPFRLW